MLNYQLLFNRIIAIINNNISANMSTAELLAFKSGTSSSALINQLVISAAYLLLAVTAHPPHPAHQ